MKRGDLFRMLGKPLCSLWKSGANARRGERYMDCPNTHPIVEDQGSLLMRVKNWDGNCKLVRPRLDPLAL